MMHPATSTTEYTLSDVPRRHTHTTITAHTSACIHRMQPNMHEYTRRGHLPIKHKPRPSPVVPSRQNIPSSAARCELTAAEASPPLMLDSLAASTRAGLLCHSSDMKLMGSNPAATLTADSVSSLRIIDDSNRCQNRSFLKMTCWYTHVHMYK